MGEQTYLEENKNASTMMDLRIQKLFLMNVQRIKLMANYNKVFIVGGTVVTTLHH